MGEEFVVEGSHASSQLDLMALAGGGGTLFLTDRHLLLHYSKRQQVLIFYLKVYIYMYTHGGTPIGRRSAPPSTPLKLEGRVLRVPFNPLDVEIQGNVKD